MSHAGVVPWGRGMHRTHLILLSPSLLLIASPHQSLPLSTLLPSSLSSLAPSLPPSLPKQAAWQRADSAAARPRVAALAASTQGSRQRDVVKQNHLISQVARTSGWEPDRHATSVWQENGFSVAIGPT